MRDLIVLGALIILLPMMLSAPFVAFLSWGWVSLASLESYVFGFSQELRPSLFCALVTMMALALSKTKIAGNFVATRNVTLFLIFIAQLTLSAIFAYEGNDRNWTIYFDFLKVGMFVLLMPVLVTSRVRIHAFVLMIVLGLSFHGMLDGLKFLASGGGHIVRGLAKFGDNNHFAVAIVMAIPLLFYLYQNSSNRWLKLAAAAVALLTVAAVLGTRSRGGFLCLVVMGFWLLMASRRKILGAVLALFAVILVVSLAPASWTERMDTIKDAKSDSSFMERVEAWQVSSAVALRNPILGGGLYAIQSQPVWDRFRGNTGLLGFVEAPISDRYRAAHSIYFQIMGDLGFFGLFIFIFMLSNAIVSGRRIRKISNEAGPSLYWARDLGDALSASLVAFIVGGAAVSMAYYEILYIYLMLMDVLKNNVENHVANSNKIEKHNDI